MTRGGVVSADTGETVAIVTHIAPGKGDNEAWHAPRQRHGAERMPAR